MPTDLRFNSLHRTVSRNGTTIKLGPTGFAITRVLARCPDGLSAEALRERIYLDRDDGGPSDDSFQVTISALRKQLAPLGLQIPRCDRWGSLYRLVEAAP